MRDSYAPARVGLLAQPWGPGLLCVPCSLGEEAYQVLVMISA